MERGCVHAILIATAWNGPFLPRVTISFTTISKQLWASSSATAKPSMTIGVCKQSKTASGSNGAPIRKLKNRKAFHNSNYVQFVEVTEWNADAFMLYS